MLQKKKYLGSFLKLMGTGALGNVFSAQLTSPLPPVLSLASPPPVLLPVEILLGEVHDVTKKKKIINTTTHKNL